MAKNRRRKIPLYKRVLVALQPTSLRGGIILFGVVFGGLGGSYFLYQSFAADDLIDHRRESQLVAKPSQGISYGSLRPIKQDAKHACAGTFIATKVKNGKQPMCVHGPDGMPLPYNIRDIAANRARIDKLVANTNKSSELEDNQLKDFASKNIEVESGQKQTSAHISSAPTTAPLLDTLDLTDITNSIRARNKCTDDGTSGQRVYLIYAHTPNVDNYAAIKPVMQNMSRAMQAVLYYNSSQTTPKVVRFLHTADCTTSVRKVALPANAIYGDTGNEYNNIVDYLQSIGYNKARHKYLIWLDAASGIDTCGIASFYPDSSPSILTNLNNINAGYAIVGNPCWSLGASLHELMHTFGAVQYNAPHADGGAHCTDEYDIMCADTPAATHRCAVDYRTINGGKTYNLDCYKDDYFSPTGTSAYFKQNWNTYSSTFLDSSFHN